MPDRPKRAEVGGRPPKRHLLAFLLAEIGVFKPGTPEDRDFITSPVPHSNTDNRANFLARF